VADDAIVITRGSQMGLALSARALFRPGDLVAVEALGYPPAWEALRSAGARLVPVPVDDGGVDVDALERLCEKKPLRGVYLTPHHQYPTMVTLSAGRRLGLLELARAKRLVVLEDDYDHEFHYEGQPVLPLAARDEHGVVVYIGTLSKVLAPGLRLGYVVGAPALVERIVALRYYLDRQGDLASERAVAELIEDGELARHLRRTRRVYLERRNHCVSELRRRFGDHLQFQVPKGGMSLWLAVRGRSVEAWFERCLRAGVGFQPGGSFTWRQKPIPRLRLGYAAVDCDAMSRALDVMWREFRGR
jgi:GntR family transcriptional regulator/MocR family aminotransferase